MNFRKVSDRYEDAGGQIYRYREGRRKGSDRIPKGVRDIFDINPGDTLLMLADKNQGIAIVQNDVYMNFADALFEAQRRAPEEAEE